MAMSEQSKKNCQTLFSKKMMDDDERMLVSERKKIK